MHSQVTGDLWALVWPSSAATTIQARCTIPSGALRVRADASSPARSSSVVIKTGEGHDTLSRGPAPSPADTPIRRPAGRSRVPHGSLARTPPQQWPAGTATETARDTCQATTRFDS